MRRTLNEFSPNSFPLWLRASNLQAHPNSIPCQRSLIFDPFSGSGRIPIGRVLAQRLTISLEMNSYAFVLTLQKIAVRFAPGHASVKDASAVVEVAASRRYLCSGKSISQ